MITHMTQTAVRNFRLQGLSGCPHQISDLEVESQDHRVLSEWFDREILLDADASRDLNPAPGETLKTTALEGLTVSEAVSFTGNSKDGSLLSTRLEVPHDGGEVKQEVHVYRFKENSVEGLYIGEDFATLTRHNQNGEGAYRVVGLDQLDWLIS